MADQHDAEERRRRIDELVVEIVNERRGREPEPAIRFEVGDRVGLLYSDHEDYVFDNPTGVITAIERGDADEPDWLTVQVEARIGADQVFLIERDKTKEAV